MDKSLILKEIQKFYNLKRKADFAHFLGINPQTLSTWYSRKTFDIEKIVSKCAEINAKWIVTGEGPMIQPKVENSLEGTPKEFIQQLFDERKRHDEIVLSQQKTIELLVSKIGSDNINQ